MEYLRLLEEASTLNAKAIALYDEIAKGKRGLEDREQADGWVKEAGEKSDLAGKMKEAHDRDAFLNEGIGSLTAGDPGNMQAALDSRLPPPGSHDKEWKSFGEFGLTVLAASNSKWERKLVDAKAIAPDAIDRLYAHQAEMKTLMQEGLGASGGFLVPVPYLAELFYKAWESSIVRPRARIVPMGSRQIQLPSLDQTITPANQKSAFFGGVSFSWIEEGESKPELEVLFKLITLTVHELAGYLPVTNALIEDSAISIDGLLRMLLPSAMADAEDWWFLNGNGAGVPQGVIASPATIQVVRAGAGTITWADIKAMVHAFQPGANGVWVIHICAMEQIMALADAAGNALWLANIVSGMPAQLMGYPIIWTEKVPVLGTKGDIGLYDFKYYLIGDRRGPTLDVSTEYLFRSNQTAFRIDERVDGQPWLSAPVALRPAGASSISPFVTLATYVAP
jgi:HK97 family phage major capsid protein